MITAQGNPPFEIGAFAHVASNPILVFSIEFAAIIQMFPQLIHSAALWPVRERPTEQILLLSVPYCLIMNNNLISEY